MPGFLAEIGTAVNTNFKSETRDLQIDNFFSKSYYIERRTIKKFINDKIFQEDDNYLIVIEGVIFNKLKLMNDYKCNSWYQCVIQLYLNNSETFFDEFRGSFSGIFFDKKKDLWLIFNSHIGDKQVFYSKLGDKMIFGSEINFLTSYYKQNSLSYSLDQDGAYMLLSYGYMFEDFTLFAEIKKLCPGNYIRLQHNNFSIKQYYRIDNTPNYKKKKNDFIEDIDVVFRNSIKNQFDKDREYGYKHLASLSGGLDSRMVAWVAHDMGYKDQLNYTFSQSNYLDETIAKSISRDLNTEWIFKALDNGNFLKDIDIITSITSGNILFYGLAHQRSIYKDLNMSKFGMVHSGQLGDVVFGTMYSSLNQNEKFNIGDGFYSYSNKLLHKLGSVNLKNEYANQEIYGLYSRGLNGANSGLLMPQEYSETFSPFYDRDVLECALAIPVELRFNHAFYKKFIIKKYPKAAQYKWERHNSKITSPKIILFNEEYYLATIPKRALTKLFALVGIKSIRGLNSTFHMNPVDYWYYTNNSLKKYFDNYYAENIENIYNLELKRDCMHLYLSGNTLEKIQVLSFLSAIKLYFN